MRAQLQHKMLVVSVRLHTLCAGDGADGARAGADVHDGGHLQPGDAEVRALADRLRQHSRQPVVHDSPFPAVHCSARIEAA